MGLQLATPVSWHGVPLRFFSHPWGWVSNARVLSITFYEDTSGVLRQSPGVLRVS